MLISFSLISVVLPAQAGMILGVKHKKHEPVGSTRASGDDPHSRDKIPPRPQFYPRKRG